MMNNKLSICSYNCKHYSVKRYKFLKELFACCDLLLLQELCLLKSMFEKLCDIDSKVSFTATSAMDEWVELCGRPFGGCAILWRSNMKYKVKKVECLS